MKIKKMLALILSLCMAVSALAACGAEKPVETTPVTPSTPEKVDTPTTTAPPATEEVVDYTGVTFRISWWGSDTRHEDTVAMIDEFEKMFPGLDVEVEYCGWGDYYTKLSTQAAGNDLPDVFQMTYDNIPAYAVNNQLMNLDDLIAQGLIDLTYVDSSALGGGMVDGSLYGLTTGINAPVIIYNPALLAEAGVTISKTPTLSEYNAVCKAVYEKTGAKACNPKYELIFRSLGGDKYATTGSALGFDAEMLSLFFKNKLKGLEEGYYIGPDDYREADTAANFAKNIVWCYDGFTNNLASWESKSELNLEMFCFPIADNATVPNATYLQPNMLWSVSKDTEYPEIAAAFLNYFVNETEVYDICGTDRGLPISSEIRAYLNTNASESDQKVSSFIDFLSDGNASEMNINAPTAGNEAFEIFNEYNEKVGYKAVKEDEIDAMAAEVVEKMNKVLAG